MSENNTSLSKLDIALRQLMTSIQLYKDNADLVSALTLAGAAEEILGKLISGKSNALQDTLDRLCHMHTIAFNEIPDKKEYVNLKNKPRNELKHLCSGNSLEINLEREASQLIDRAINNYKNLTLTLPELYNRFKEFEQIWIDRNY